MVENVRELIQVRIGGRIMKEQVKNNLLICQELVNDRYSLSCSFHEQKKTRKITLKVRLRVGSVANVSTAPIVVRQ